MARLPLLLLLLPLLLLLLPAAQPLPLARRRAPRRPRAAATKMQLVAAPLEVARTLGASYGAALTAQPMLTNILTAVVLSGVSDVIAQRIASPRPQPASETSPLGVERSRIDKGRVAWMLVWGGAVPGYFLTYWFKWLAMLFPADGMTLARAAQKTFVNQLFMSPGLNMAFFAFVLITREGAARKAPKEPPMRLNGEGPPPPRGFWPQYKAKLRADLWPTIVRSCGFWGTVQMVNFRYVPETLTLLYTNVAFLIWTVYVSIVGHRKVDVRAGGDKQKKELSLQKVQVNS